jgi:hypothetical protein
VQRGFAVPSIVGAVSRWSPGLTYKTRQQAKTPVNVLATAERLQVEFESYYDSHL